MKKLIIGFLFIFIIVLAIPTYLGPYLRGLISEEKASFTVKPTIYDCSDGSCIGFSITKVSQGRYDDLTNKLIYPYNSSINTDSFQNQWVHLLENPERQLCIEGYIHRFPVNTLRFFQAGYGGYRFKLLALSEEPCSAIRTIN